ncbi:TPA: hypothetical protein ACNP37_005528, partial [Raoultella ornithinolytica]
MSENNYGALMMKSVLSANININDVILPGIYPLSLGNSSAPATDGGVLAVYSGDVKHRSFSSDSVPFATSTYNTSSSKWNDWSFTVSQNDLAENSGQLMVGSPGIIQELRQIEISIIDSVKTDGAITPFDGGMAEWIYDSSDLSYEVANYPRLFIAPDRDPTGATGAWRLNVGEIINAVQYGLG